MQLGAGRFYSTLEPKLNLKLAVPPKTFPEMATTIVPNRYIARADLINLLDRLFTGEQYKVSVRQPPIVFNAPLIV